MSGLVMASEEDPLMRAAVGHCRAAFKIPYGKAFHWKDHVKTYPRRQLVARKLSGIQGACVNYVIIEKAAIPATAGMYNDHATFYNYVAGLMMERLLFTADTWPGGPRDIMVRFGHVRGFNHSVTPDYLAKKRRRQNGTPWHLLRKIQFPGASQCDGLQAADQYGGVLKVAIVPDEFGGLEEHHLLTIKHQIRRHRELAWGAGFKVMAIPGTMEQLPWWSTAGLGRS
jgi:hypothetical protein